MTSPLLDPLTGLPGPALFADRLGHALALAARRGEAVAVLLLAVEAGAGAAGAAGPDLRLAPRGEAAPLVAVGRRVAETVRRSDSVARLEGARFGVLLEGVTDVMDVAVAAERLLDRLAAPLPTPRGPLRLRPRAGIALSAGHEAAAELLGQAEAALADVRRTGHAPYGVYDPSMTEGAWDHAALETELARAAAAGELRVHYQPTVALATGRIEAQEALLRWVHPRRGLLSPAAFLPLAELTGLIFPVGRWVLAAAARDAAAWAADASGEDGGEGGGAPTLVVNLSARQFRHPGLAGDVARALREAGLPPGSLRLEIPQAALLDEPEAAAEGLRALRGVGVRVGVDGFRTGYAVAGLMRHPGGPVDALKLERGVTAGLGRDPEAGTIAAGALAFARAQGLRATAEGVETAAQAAELHRLGYDAAQGHFFAPPLPAAEVAALAAAPPWGR